LRGEQNLTVFREPASLLGGARRVQRAAAELLSEAKERERAACIPEAIGCYEAAIAEAERRGESTVLCEALRRLGILRCHRDSPGDARALCERSYAVAREAGNDFLAAEALNTLGGLDLRTGALVDARKHLLHALKLGGHVGELRARAEQNLGVLASIQGNVAEALTHYESALEAYRNAGNEHGCGIAYVNLGIVSADATEYDVAANYFQRSFEIAERVGDAHLQGLCLVGHAGVHLARQRYDEARRNAESALAIFDQLGVQSTKAEAYRLIGMVYRETGRFALAESRLRSALELAAKAGSVQGEADAMRELALLHQSMGRNQEALTALNTAHRLYRRLDARVELVNLESKVAALENTYLAVVRDWGQSIESADSYTHGHCERVAQNAVAVAKALGLDDYEQKTIRLGAYLHDVGKVKVPHEILNKPGALTSDEFEVIQMHPVWGIELLANVEFPWDIKPIIRWHHEKYSGAGYPDRLRGDEIPLSAQVVGIVDVYDALTTTRAYRPALTHETALSELTRMRASWSARVFDAFMRAVGDSPAAPLTAVAHDPGSGSASRSRAA
jgi:putative nucleotidyltransferase with HDIG domain